MTTMRTMSSTGNTTTATTSFLSQRSGSSSCTAGSVRPSAFDGRAAPACPKPDAKTADSFLCGSTRLASRRSVKRGSCNAAPAAIIFCNRCVADRRARPGRASSGLACAAGTLMWTSTRPASYRMNVRPPWSPCVARETYRDCRINRSCGGALRVAAHDAWRWHHLSWGGDDQFIYGGRYLKARRSLGLPCQMLTSSTYEQTRTHQSNIGSIKARIAVPTMSGSTASRASTLRYEHFF